MKIVSTIRPGHIIRTENDDFTVRGSINVRGRYAYVCTNKAGRDKIRSKAMDELIADDADLY